VFYRATAARRAKELGLVGYARNLPDGRVEVLAAGEEGDVDVFLAWLWEGSSASKVTDVATAVEPLAAVQNLTGFASL
jgi:acylphosphatase